MIGSPGAFGRARLGYDGTPMTTHSNDRDNNLCAECGGLCCMLYLAIDEEGAYCGDGWLEEYVELWIERLTNSGALRIDENGRMVAGEAGVDPLHDPRLSTRPGAEGEAYRASLPAWVDVSKCQFCHPDTGCLLPRHRRAGICGEWVCEFWEAAEGPTL